MSCETEEIYTYTDFPLTQDVPEPVHTYQRKYGYYPEVVVVNSVNRVFWQAFTPVKGPSRVPSAALQSNQDILGMVLPEYIIGINYSDTVSLDQMACRGVATTTN